jgi:hypothetical protein
MAGQRPALSKIIRVIRRRRRLLALAAAGAFVATSIGTVTHADDPSTVDSPASEAAARAAAVYQPYDFTPTRHTRPRDRYEPAGGCYALRSAATGKYVVRSGSTFAATGAKGEPLHFQAYDLGKYLLFASRADFLAAAADPAPGGARPATQVAGDYLRGTGDESLKPVREPVLGALDQAAAGSDAATAPVRAGVRGSGIVAAAAPSAAAEWLLQPAGKGAFALQLPVDDGHPENPGPPAPPVAGTLTAAKDGALSIAAGKSAGAPATFSLELTSGCAVFPEAQLNITGPHATGSTPYAETKGYFDGHLHGMAFEFLGGRARCGRPWHPYGITYALVDCPDHSQTNGRGAILEDILSGNTPGTGHDTVGWPTFGYWPNNASLTHEQVYYSWLERAWLGGLRMYTNLLVDNGQLCELYPYKKNSCNEMDGVRLQAQRLHEFVRYIDAQSGGPGKGWLQIVTDPFQARRLVNAGKLAVVMGIEVSVPLDCGEYLGTAKCDAAQVDKRLQEVYDIGVRQMEMTNKFDNALTGVTGDDAATGVIVNVGNRGETGHFWKMQTCPNAKDPRQDKTQYNMADESGGNIGRDAIFGAVLQASGETGAAPLYPAGPHCNVVGLTELGKTFLAGMMKRGMIFDPDHMSAKARQAALDVVEKAGYSGVISSHSWADDYNYRQILRMGGVVTPHSQSSTSFVAKWRKLRTWADSRYTFGLGWGSDVNGFSAQGAPRNPNAGQGVTYPFTGLGGARVDKQVTGKHVWDINTEGVDHYGLYPDWVQDATILAGAQGAQFTADIERGAESFLQMWERALGVKGNSCRSDVRDATGRDLARVKPGMTPEQVLVALGQPQARSGSSFEFCATTGKATVTFVDGRVARTS